MALRDHFRPPLSIHRHWHAFHNGWASSIAADLNTKLPDGFFAEPNVQFGIEIDVAAFEESPGALSTSESDAPSWKPPPPVLTVPLPLLTDLVEIAIYQTEGGPVLAGAIELVSPANKDRPAHREAFLSKCRSYIQQGLGLVIVDIVTDRRADLHRLLLLGLETDAGSANPTDLYAASYRPIERDGQPRLDIWHEPMTLRHPLPTVPLWLRGGLCLPVDLDASYERTCREQRIAAEG